jgi:hypothetical protein
MNISDGPSIREEDGVSSSQVKRGVGRRNRSWCAVIAVLFLGGAVPASCALELNASVPDRHPVRFVANEGQIDPTVRFTAYGSRYSLSLSAGEANLTFRDPDSPLSKKDRSGSARLRMVMVGADPRAAIEGRKRLPGRFHYRVGAHCDRWRSNLRSFAEVRYRRVYPGIDLSFYGNAGSLEYDFIVAPGADPDRILLRMDGARGMRLDPKGDLRIETDAG